MADKRISQLIERTDIANNDVLPIVASGATTTNKVTISTIQTWMQDNLDVGVTSVGLSMPSAFVVSNSPVTASGNITVTGAGTVAQYIRGDGSLADFPQSAGGGGASVSYYLNGSVSQGTIGGIAYLEMNKTPILGAGTDFTINADGYIASFITDAGDPGLLEIPAGNWNFETYIQASSGGGSPTFYIELYKVNSGGTATLIASNSGTPESISLGTNINPYFSALAVPQTTLALTDRIALRYYVTHAGRTITLHTENSHLCQIITTFTTGLTALNGLTAQVQNFATGTSGTDFNISSAGSTHTFNIPSASATARGLVTTGSQTIAGAKTFSDDAVINGVNVGRGASSVATNTRLGSQTLVFNTTGSSNTSVGWSSLYLNTTGSANSSFGTLSLENNTTGTGNTAIGYVALRNNTTGGSNTATGYLALNANTTGNANTANGAYALENNTTGSDNTAVGQEALENNIVGAFNTAIGFQALKENTNSSNTAIGYLASSKNTSGSSNFSGGARALENTTTGSVNTSVGFASLQQNTTGGGNVAIGEDAGRYTSVTSVGNTNGNDSVFIGRQSKPLGDSQTNQIVIGHLAVGNGSNTVTLGNDSITTTFLKGNISLKGENSAVKSIQYTNPSGTLHWSVQTSFGSAGEHQPFSIRNGVLGTDAILIQPASNNITLNNSITNLLGSLSGTSATFAGRARFQGTGYDTLGSAEIMLTNTTASTGRSFIVNSSNAGEFLISDVSAGQTRLSINSSGAVTLTGALSGTSASFTSSGISVPLEVKSTTSNFGRIRVSSTTSTAGNYRGYEFSNGSSFRGGLVQDESTEAISIFTPVGGQSFTLASTGAATFSSSVTATQMAVGNTSFNGVLSVVGNSATNGLTVKSAGNAGTFPFRVTWASGTDGDMLCVDDNGNVGIGTPTPSCLFQARGSDSLSANSRNLKAHIGGAGTWGSNSFEELAIGFSGIRSTYTSGDNWDLSFSAGTSTTFAAGTQPERMRITSGGNVLAYQNYIVQKNGSDTIGSGPFLSLQTATGTNYQQNIQLGASGSLDFWNFDSSSWNMRMRITSGGNVLIGTQTQVARVSVDYSDSNNNGISINETSGAASTFLMLFRSNGANKGSIQINSGNTGVNFNTTSDYRLKEDLQDYNGLEIINKIKTYDYKWKNIDFRSYGVLAHELQEIMPDIISGKKDEVDEEGNEIMQGVDYSKIVPILIKGMQEQQEQIKSLSEQVEALKSQING